MEVKNIPDSILIDLKKKYDTEDIYEIRMSKEDDDLLRCFNDSLVHDLEENTGARDIDIYYSVDKDDRLNISVMYSYADDEVAYEQTDVDSFNETSVSFQGDWNERLNLGEGTLGELIVVIRDYIQRDIELGVENAVEDFCKELQERK